MFKPFPVDVTATNGYISIPLALDNMGRGFGGQKGLVEFGIHCDSLARPAALGTGGQLITLLCHFQSGGGTGDVRSKGGKRKPALNLP